MFSVLCPVQLPLLCIQVTGFHNRIYTFEVYPGLICIYGQQGLLMAAVFICDSTTDRLVFKLFAMLFFLVAGIAEGFHYNVANYDQVL